MTKDQSGQNGKIARQQRQAAALRANLQRRKAQARATARQGAAAGAQAAGDGAPNPSGNEGKSGPRG